MSEFISGRDALEGVDPLFVDRWSPRALLSDPIDQETLNRIFEAARWAPSAYNEQPWRFYTSTPETFEAYLSLLMDGNKPWAKDAAVIGFLVGKKTFTLNAQDNASYQLDCGSAWMSMALQAHIEGLYTHGMAGIEREAILEHFNLDPNEYFALMGFTIAKKGDPATLPDNYRKMEAPSGRKSLAEIWFK